MNINREDLDVLLSEEQIQTRIKEIGAQISEAYRDRGDLHVIAVLKGSFMFLTDLVKAIDLELTVDFPRLVELWGLHGDERRRSNDTGLVVADQKPPRFGGRRHRRHRFDPEVPGRKPSDASSIVVGDRVTLGQTRKQNGGR